MGIETPFFRKTWPLYCHQVRREFFIERVGRVDQPGLMLHPVVNESAVDGLHAQHHGFDAGAKLRRLPARHRLDDRLTLGHG